MKRLLLLLVPAAWFAGIMSAGQTRYARLGQFEGNVEVQLHAANPWSAAERNLPLTESAWLRTGPASRLEIELDEGSAFRIGADSQIELSDYSRLSTGQRITVLSLDHGVAWFTGEPAGKDSLILAVPGAQATLLHGARVRLEVGVTVSRITVIEGTVRLSCPAAELDVREGQTVRVEPMYPARFGLDHEIAPVDLDRWSEDRDKALETSTSSTHVAQRFGVNDLDAAGEWIQTDIGAVWKPKVTEGWAPFQKGRWRWYDSLGYTWVSDEAWGWLPYHYGRWTRKNDLGWVWSPGTSTVFKPGDVYWLRGATFAAWGPLAPGENWSPVAPPQQFLNVNTTYASFAQDAQVIDPAGFTERPKEPLTVATFALALPSPAFPAWRLEAVRPMLRVGSTHVTPVIPGSAFQEQTELPPPPQQPAMPPPTTIDPPSSSAPPPDPGPPGPPMQVIYPVPVYTGIVVMNPPEHPDYSRRNPNNPPPAPAKPPLAVPTSQTAKATGDTTAPPPSASTKNTPKPNPVPAPIPTVPTIAAPPRVTPPPINRPTITPSAPPPQTPKIDPPRRDTPAPPPRVIETPKPRVVDTPKPDVKPAKDEPATTTKKQ